MVVKGPELFGAEFQRTGDVQRVESAHAKGWTVPVSQIDASLPRAVGKIDFEPHTVQAVLRELLPEGPGPALREPGAKYLQAESMSEFGAVKRREVYRDSRAHTPVRLGRVFLLRVEGGNKTAIRADDQKRLFLSAIRSSTMGTTRSPKVRLRRAAKSGIWAGWGLGDSGTIRATTRFRLRNSMTCPASIQLISWGVFRSSRRFTLGTL